VSSTIAHYIIDPSGELWDAGELVAQQALCQFPITASAQRLIDDLVVSKGYAGFRGSDRACQVFVNPQRVRQATIDAVRALVNRQSAPLMISGCYGGGWDYRLHVSKMDGLDHIAARIEQSHQSNCFHSRKISEANLARSGRGPLTDALDLVRDSGGRFDNAFLPKLAALTKRRFLICRWHPEGRLWRVEHSGAGYHSSHIDVAQHRTVSCQPSFEYGCWVHDRYVEIMMRVTPEVEDIDAMVTTPGVGERRMQYRRLLAPMTDAHGNALLLSTSVRDATIDLGCGGARAWRENAPLAPD